MKEKNYWPLGLAIFGSFFLVALFFTLKIAIGLPVEMDNSYMNSYQYVDKHYDEIMQKEKSFDLKYSAVLSGKLERGGSSVVSIDIKDKNGSAVSGARIETVVTRPDTSKHDIKLSEFTEKNGVYAAKLFAVPLDGRWKIQSKVCIGSDEKYIFMETNCSSKTNLIQH